MAGLPSLDTVQATKMCSALIVQVTIQYTAQYITLWYLTLQYTTIQYNTVQYSCPPGPQALLDKDFPLLQLPHVEEDIFKQQEEEDKSLKQLAQVLICTWCTVLYSV